jgi:glycosyltransferase involved in cell wall biosynthesis
LAREAAGAEFAGDSKAEGTLMGDAPRLAILVAFHDDGETIAETIDSLRGEPHSELVIVDDGSTDPASLDALDVVEGTGVRVLHQPNSGPASAWMAGLSATSAPYVMPFSSDDVLVAGAAGVLADALDSNAGAAAAWGDMRSFGAATAYIPATPELCPWHVTYVNTRPGIALFRREALLAVGGWQLTTGIEDWDLWMRIATAGLAGVHVPHLIFQYRRDAGGRFRGRVNTFEGFYEELRGRNAQLFARRAENRRLSPAPRLVKTLIPLIDRLPYASRLLKVQLCELVTLLLWSAGIRTTISIVSQGVLFRLRVPRGRER